jgi:t-SNARE complex subunit (syntaxin)
MRELVDLFNKLNLDSIKQSEDLNKIVQQMNEMILDENTESQNIDNIIESLDKLNLNENNIENIHILRQICIILIKKLPCGTQLHNTVFRPNFVH